MELKRAIFIKRDELPPSLVDVIESEEIREELIPEPWDYVAYYEALASVIQHHQKTVERTNFEIANKDMKISTLTTRLDDLARNNEELQVKM